MTPVVRMRPIVTDTSDFPTLIRDGNVYVDKSAQNALDQCHARNYAAPYAADKRAIVYVGVNYDPLKRTVDTLISGVGEIVNEVVKSFPGVRKPGILKKIGKSRATVERSVARLVAARCIEFRGAPKNGGYYAI